MTDLVDTLERIDALVDYVRPSRCQMITAFYRDPSIPRSPDPYMSGDFGRLAADAATRINTISTERDTWHNFGSGVICGLREIR